MAASFGIEAGVIVAAQSIAQGAAEIAAGLGEAARAAEERRKQRREERRRMREARRAGEEKQRREIVGQETEHQFARLFAAANTATQEDLAARLHTLEKTGASLQARLAAFLEQVQQATAADAANARRVLVARILERLELGDDEPLPPELDALALQIVEAGGDARVEALATELRLQVQHHNTTRAAALEQLKMQEAAAVVLEQSLKDLGYAVEEIEETLFVESGVAHFQRPEWGDYFIRLRIDPKRQAMNFNVVRAGKQGEDRRREDMLAEERWCSEFPKLFETLKARGIPITVTRLLQAGEAPVQIVDAASLPARNEEERHHRHSPISKELAP